MRLRGFIRKASDNDYKPVYALKCDVKKFFHSIDHRLLLQLTGDAVDPSTQRLIEIIVKSFWSEPGKGLPLGNVTSQLFANIYLNELDQFVKHALREKFYLRYCDDFIILHENEHHLSRLIEPISAFLDDRLGLKLHPDKMAIRKLSWGVDFLGYIVFPYHIVIRRRTMRRMVKKMNLRRKEFSSGLISADSLEHARQSYLGLLTHCNGYKLSRELFTFFASN